MREAGDYEEGFLTTENNFLDRAEAYELTIKNGRITDEKAHIKGLLFSEDLY